MIYIFLPLLFISISGGSVWIEASSLSGSGSITANGGSSSSTCGSGAGGRIAVHLDTVSSFAGTMQAAGGLATTPVNLAQGSAGTIYFSHGKSVLTIDNLGRAAGKSTMFQNFTATLDVLNVLGAAEVVLANGTQLAVDTISSTTLNGLVHVHEGSQLTINSTQSCSMRVYAGGLLNVTNSLSASNLSTTRSTILDLQGSLGGITDLELIDARMSWSQTSSTYGNPAGTFNFNNVILTNSTLTITANLSTSSPTYFNANNLNLGNSTMMLVGSTSFNLAALIVGGGSAINASTGGYAYMTGVNGGFATNSPGGGAHGGRGGSSTSETFGGATPYGNLYAPTEFGSGGYRGSGGGAIHIISTSALVDGNILSNGATACGSGAGGSIWIESSSSFSGSGSVTANGGFTTSTSCATGGGGRIAIHSQTIDFYGVAQASAGIASSSNSLLQGTAGTVFLNASGTTTLLLDNNDGFSSYRTVLSHSNDVLSFDYVVLERQAELEINNNTGNLSVSILKSSSKTGIVKTFNFIHKLTVLQEKSTLELILHSQY